MESAKLWYEHELCSTLLDLGYARNAVDQSVFNKGVCIIYLSSIKQELCFSSFTLEVFMILVSNGMAVQ